jgi:lipopolysaccharide transport system ATP-binding protein
VSDTAIQTSGLGKSYRLGTARRGYDTLRESFGRVASQAFRRAHQPPDPNERLILWALRDLSLTITDGEIVGLIGHNGAGKTTLLRILSRISEPTSGWAEVTGNVGSLLEVGTGFHPELTGRENIFLNGAVLGMRREQIRRRFDEIVEFAEIQQFLDTPVKRYSSGMSVRLAFAVAAHLEPSILLVDEVLAVGDAAFQRKSLGKMGEVASRGRTVLFVSHNLAIIQSLCQRGVLLERGGMVADGSIGETVATYLRSLERSATGDVLSRSDHDGRGYRDTMVCGLGLRDARTGVEDVVVSGNPATISVDLTELVPLIQCHLTILNSLGQPVCSFDSQALAPGDERLKDIGPHVECEIPSLPLLPGRYRIDILVRGRNQIQDGLQAATFFNVEPGVIGGRPSPAFGVEGVVVLPHTWRLPS